MLRQVLPPLVTAYVIFVAMIVLVRRRPVPRPHGRSDRTVRAGAGRFVRTALGGYVAFLVIVLVFHVWLAGERDAFASAVWGGAFLTSIAAVAALGSSLIGRRRRRSG